MIARRCLLLTISAFVALALASCGAGRSPGAVETAETAGRQTDSGATGSAGNTGSAALASATPGPAQRASTAGAGSRGTVTPPALNPPGASVVLTWWTPDFLKPGAGQAGGPLLATYLSEFASAQAGQVRIVPVVKARYGRSGLLDLMRAARPVAQGILPDLVALDLADLPAAAAAGLLQPLDGLIPASVLDDFYPFARQAGQVNGHIVAVPIVADVEHVIYNRDRVKSPPDTWTALRAGSATYLFPAGSPPAPAAGNPSEAVQRAFVSHYLSAGGAINSETRQLVLEDTPLLRVLTFYGQGSASGLLPPQAAEMISLEECWSAYVDGLASVANVSARRYLAGRAGLTATDYGPIPGWNAPATPVASGWALAVVTTDPERQRAAAAWIAWLVAPEHLGPWTQAAGWLPVRGAAWATWGSQPYYDFLQAQLASAVPVPAGLPDSQAAVQLQKGVLSVLRNTASPAEAVRAVLTPQPPK